MASSDRRRAGFERVAISLLVAASVLIIPVRDVPGGERATVPVRLQAELLSKLAIYDRSFEARAAGRVNILIAYKDDSPDSRRAASQMQDAFASRATIGKYPHTEVLTNYTSAGALAAEIRAKRISIVVIPPGFDEDIEAIRSALVGVDVLSAGAVPSYVPRGIVVGIDLVEAKPKMLVNITQAKKQNVALSAELLKLMTVYR